MRKLKLIFIVLVISVFSHSFLFGQQPTAISNGLALYKLGEGKPVLLMPYPHASAYYPMAQSKLVGQLNSLGYSVLTFDPPGIYNSERRAEVTLDEMLSCANELLDYFNITDSILVVGHSQSGFCSIAYSVEFPERVNRLVLVGSVSGWPKVRKASVHKHYGFFTIERWKIMYWGTRKMLKSGNLYIHKKLDQMVRDISYADTSFVKKIPVEKSDRKKPEPIRAEWMVNLRKYNYDYSEKLNEIHIPTLICVGKYDPQTPVTVSQQLSVGIANSKLVIFDSSGHSPFIEEKQKFISELEEFVVDSK